MSNDRRPTAVVVDDATAIRQSLPALLGRLEVIGSFSSSEQFDASGLRPEVVVLDLHLVNARQQEVRQGVAALRHVRGAGHRVCIYTQEERPFVLAACLAAGAFGIASKADSLEHAEAAFLEVAAGGTVIPRSLVGAIELLVRRGQITLLSPRQRDVLAGRARGLTYAEMASRLFLSESTLRGYWRETAEAVRDYLAETTPSDIEHALGLAPGDLLEIWAEPDGAAADRQTRRRWWSI